MSATPSPEAGWDENDTGVAPVGSAELSVRIDTDVVTPIDSPFSLDGEAIIDVTGVDRPAVICGVVDPTGNVAEATNRIVLSRRYSGSKLGTVSSPSAARSPVTDFASSMNRRVSAPVTRKTATVIPGNIPSSPSPGASISIRSTTSESKDFTRSAVALSGICE